MHLVPEAFGPMGDHMAGAIRIDAARAATIAHDPLDRRLMGALSEHDAASRLDDGGLLPRDGLKGVAENADVVETDARNGDRDRVGCARGVPATVELLKQYEAPMILAWGMLIGGTVLMLAFQPWNHMPIVDAKMIEIVLYIIVFGTMAGFSMYMQSVKLIGGVKAGLYACIEPVAATILSVVWMKVQFAPMDLLGFVLILATIFVLAIPTKEERRGAGIRG